VFVCDKDPNVFVRETNPNLFRTFKERLAPEGHILVDLGPQGLGKSTHAYKAGRLEIRFDVARGLLRVEQNDRGRYVGLRQYLQIIVVRADSNFPDLSRKIV